MIDLRELPLPTEPYRGIEPFRLIDEPIFLERTDAIERLRNFLSLYRGVLLYGESGSGKSSLINAGLLPQMLRQGRWPERIRVQPKAGAELYIERIAVWERTVQGDNETRKGNSSGLSRFLPSRFSETDSEERIEVSCTEFLRRLEDADDGIPLLIFDQFEELVTLFEEAPTNRERFEEADLARAEIIRLIGGMLLAESRPLKVIFAFRDDYLGKLTPIFLTVPNLTDQFVRLSLPPASALQQIVRGPFGITNESGVQIGLPDHFADPFDPELVEKIIAGLNERSLSGLVNLSEAQTLCQVLWRGPTFRDELRRATMAPPGTFQSELTLMFGQLASRPWVLVAGRTLVEFIHLQSRLRSGPVTCGQAIENILGRHVAAIFAQMPRDTQKPAVTVLSKLVTPRGTRNVVSGDDLLDARPPKARKQVAALDALKKIGLIRQQLRAGTTYYEVTSEFVIPWILSSKAASRLRRSVLLFYLAFGLAALVVTTAVGITIWALDKKSAANVAADRALKAKQKFHEAAKQSDAEAQSFNARFSGLVLSNGVRNEMIKGLRPEAAKLAQELIDAAQQQDIELGIVSGFRSVEEQDRLYAMGRTQPGNKVTNAKGGCSIHNTGLAFDIGVFQDGKYVPDSSIYAEVGRIGMRLGLVWGGNWEGVKDEPHFQTQNAEQARRLLCAATVRAKEQAQ